jgi:hypothetical protein
MGCKVFLKPYTLYPNPDKPEKLHFVLIALVLEDGEHREGCLFKNREIPIFKNGSACATR